MTAEPAASLACDLAYHVAMKPSVVILLAACGLPVPFSTTLKQHVQVSVPRVTLITFTDLLHRQLHQREWSGLSELLPEARALPFDFSVNGFVFCSDSDMPSARLDSLRLYSKVTSVSKEAVLDALMRLQLTMDFQISRFIIKQRADRQAASILSSLQFFKPRDCASLESGSLSSTCWHLSSEARHGAPALP